MERQPKYLAITEILGVQLALCLFCIASHTNAKCPHKLEFGRHTAVCDHGGDATKKIEPDQFDIYTDAGEQTLVGHFVMVFGDDVYFTETYGPIETLLISKAGKVTEVGEWYEGQPPY